MTQVCVTFVSNEAEDICRPDYAMAALVEVLFELCRQVKGKDTNVGPFAFWNT